MTRHSIHSCSNYEFWSDVVPSSDDNNGDECDADDNNDTDIGSGMVIIQ